jgi:chaperonin cofactor prefoldin
MPVSHLLQTEIVQSEIVNDSNPFITTTNLQDDLNQIRAVIRFILGRNSWLSLSNIKTIDFLTTWFNNNVLSNGKINANSIDYSVVSNVDSYPAVLRNSSTWLKLEPFSSFLNSQNKLLWSGISFTTADIDSAISPTSTITTINTRLSNLESSLNTTNANVSTLQSSVNNLSTRVTNAETNITNLSTRTTNLESQTSSLDTRLTNLEGRVTALENNSGSGGGGGGGGGGGSGTCSGCVDTTTFSSTISSINNNINQLQQEVQAIENKNQTYGNLLWHPVIFNRLKLKNFLDGIETLDNVVDEVSDFYTKVQIDLNVSIKEIILPVYLHKFVEKQTEIKNLINALLTALPSGVRVSLLFELTVIPDNYISLLQTNTNFLEYLKYQGMYSIYFYDPYEAKFCTDLNDLSTCTNATESQAQMLKRAMINSLPSVIENVGVFVRNLLNLNKIFDHLFLNVKKKFKDVKFKLITNFFNIYNGPYSDGTETYYIDISKFLNKIESDFGLDIFYLDDLVWLEKYDQSNPPATNGIFIFNDLITLSSLFGSSISIVDKVVQTLKASKRKIALIYDYLDSDLSTFNLSGSSVSFNLSNQSLRQKYIVFNDLNTMTEEIDEAFYEKVTTLTKDKHYIRLSPGEKIITNEGSLTEIYVVSDYSADVSISIIEAKFGELASSPSLVIDIDATNGEITIESSTYSVNYDDSSYNFIKIEIGQADVNIYFNEEETPIHTSSASLQDRSIVIKVENTDSANQLKVYGIFKR